MASSGGAGKDVPAARAAAAVNDLIEAREGVSRLRSFLLQLDQEPRPPCAELVVVDGVLARLSSATSALGVSGAAAGGHQSPAAGSGGAGHQQQSVSSGGITGNLRSHRRSQPPYDKRITATLDDGHVWRKYGQKEIQNSPHPSVLGLASLLSQAFDASGSFARSRAVFRLEQEGELSAHALCYRNSNRSASLLRVFPRSYFRCTHKSDQGCNAKRHVQLCDTDPSKYVITYYGEHTCRDPSTVPLIFHTAGAAPDGSGTSNLISFTPSCAPAAAAAASSQLTVEGSVTQLSSSWCTSDGVLSSSAGSLMQVDGLGAVVGSSAGVMSNTVVPAPPDSVVALGDVPGGGGAGVGSFPSSPNSLGFAVSIDDDDDDDFLGLNP
ncbi:hypothetical protein ACP70R_014098 [Stipagrostis hirtigluma subsp. patula]